MSAYLELLPGPVIPHRHSRFTTLTRAAVGAVGIDKTLRAIPVDDHLRAAPGVWAPGDITGKNAFTHMSVYQARIVLADILGERRARARGEDAREATRGRQLMAPIDRNRAPPQLGRSGRITPNLFSIAFGLAGLGQAWHAAGPVLGTPGAVPDAVYILTAGVWLVLVAAYAVRGPRRMLADLRDPVQSSFPSLAAITPMILGTALATVAFTVGRILVMIFLAITIVLGGWLTGQRPRSKAATGCS